MLVNSAMAIFKKSLPNWIQVDFVYSYFQKKASISGCQELELVGNSQP